MKIVVGDVVETIQGRGVVESIPPDGITGAAMVHTESGFLPVLCEGSEVLDNEKRLLR